MQAFITDSLLSRLLDNALSLNLLIRCRGVASIQNTDRKRVAWRPRLALIQQPCSKSGAVIAALRITDQKKPSNVASLAKQFNNLKQNR
jgi:hypothetical protein